MFKFALAALSFVSATAESFTDIDLMYEHIDDVLDVGEEILEFSDTDFGTTEDTAAYAGDVIVVLFEHDADFTLEWAAAAGSTGLEHVVSWNPTNDGATYEAGIGI